MILPKKLMPVTEKELLEEVAQELNLDIKDVNKTFDIWLDYLNHLANETDQCTINIPHLGKMYADAFKLKTSKEEGEKEIREKKMERIKEFNKEKKYVSHCTAIPVTIKYGLGRKRYIPGKQYTEWPKYTVRDLINIQAEYFFNEDYEYADQKDKYKRYFIDDTEDSEEDMAGD